MRLTLPLFAGMSLQVTPRKAPVPSSLQFTSNAPTARQPLTRDVDSFSKVHSQPRFGAAMPPPGGGDFDPYDQWSSEPNDDFGNIPGWNPWAGVHGELETTDPSATPAPAETEPRKKRGPRPGGDLSMTPHAIQQRQKRREEAKAAGRELGSQKRGRRPDGGLSMTPHAIRQRQKRQEEAEAAGQEPSSQKPGPRPDGRLSMTPHAIQQRQKKRQEAEAAGQEPSSQKPGPRPDGRLSMTPHAIQQRQKKRQEAETAPKKKPGPRPDGGLSMTPHAIQQRQKRREEAEAAGRELGSQKRGHRPDGKLSMTPNAIRLRQKRREEAEAAGRELGSTMKRQAESSRPSGGEIAQSQPGSGVSESEQGGYSSTGLTKNFKKTHLTGPKEQDYDPNTVYQKFLEEGINEDIPSEYHLRLIGTMTSKAMNMSNPVVRDRALEAIRKYNTAFAAAFPTVEYRNKQLGTSLTKYSGSSSNAQAGPSETRNQPEPEEAVSDWSETDYSYSTSSGDRIARAYVHKDGTRDFYDSYTGTYIPGRR